MFLRSWENCLATDLDHSFRRFSLQNGAPVVAISSLNENKLDREDSAGEPESLLRCRRTDGRLAVAFSRSEPDDDE